MLRVRRVRCACPILAANENGTMNTSIRYVGVLALLLAACTLLSAQTDVAFEFQAYPTGLIPGLRLSKAVGTRAEWHVRLGYNWIRHGDAGVHEDERGAGYGGTLGYDRYFGESRKGFFAGVRCDLWRNTIDWKDRIGQADELSGTTRILVVQPTLEAGWWLPLDQRHFAAPTLAFGFEKNVVTEGEPTGEGAILLLGVRLGFRR